MRFRSINAHNFRTLQDVTLSLRRESGLYYMTGRNLDRPRLGTNGVGKSSLWQALHWCGYGVTADALRAEILKGEAKRDGYDVLVEVGRHGLERSWRPNDLKMDDKPVADFGRVWPLNAVEFRASVLACQDGQMLLDYTPTQRLELVSGVLNLDRWSRMSKNASELAVKRQSDLQTIVYRIGQLRAQLKELRVMDVTRQVEKFEQERTNRLRTLKRKLTDVRETRTIARTAFRKVTQEKEELEDKRKRLQSVKSHDQDVGDRAAQYASVEIVKGRLEHVKDVLGQLCVHEEGKKWVAKRTCDVCGSHLTDAQARARVDALLARSKKLKAELAEAELVLETADRRRASNTKQQEQQQHFMLELEESIKDAGERSLNLLFEHQKAAKAVADMRAEIDKVRHEPNPHRKSNDKLLKRIRMHKRELADTCNAENDARNALERAEWWIKGFKEIRYDVLEDALGELSAVTQANLLAFGMHGFNVDFVAERETKAGTTSHTFDVAIRTPYRRSLMPLEALSGGERARLRLASAFALSDFLLRRRSLVCNVEVYDEPTQHLSREGIDMIVELLADRAQQSGKQIWLVDHNVLVSSKFASTVCLELKNGKTRIRE